jgi:hypothetical protein
MPTQYTTVLRLRMLPEDYAAVKAKAEAYRQPLSAFARNAICGIPMICHLDEDAVEMLLRLGGLLLKHGRVAPGGDGEDTGWTIAQRKAFLELAHRLLGIASRIEESLPTDSGQDSPC